MQDVVGLDVAMHDAALVGEGEGARGLEQVATRVVVRERSLAMESHGEIFPVHERHHEVDQPFTLVDRIDRDDVRMTELRRRLCLAQEARSDLAAEGELRREHLHGDLSLQAPVTGQIHDAHAPASDFPIQLIVRAENALDVRAKLVVGR